MEMVAVPFKSERYGASYTQQITTNGVIRMEENALVIEFRDTTLDYGTMGTSTGSVELVNVPLADVESLTVSRKWPWGSRLMIRARSLAALDGIPTSKGNECALKIRRRDHERARELAIAVSLHLANEEMRRLGETPS